MSHACVAFGPHDGYLFSSSYGWRCKDVPQGVVNLLNGPHRARDIHEIALGPDGSYAAVYVDQAGTRRFSGHGVPDDLKNWLTGPGRDLDDINIALGPNKAFFAFDSTGAIWDELPEAFEKDIRSLLVPGGSWKYGKNPVSVSFGPDGDYIFITSDGCAGFHLNDDYPAGLKKHVLQKQFFQLKNTVIILNPSRLGTYLILSSDGTAEGAFPPDCVAHFREFSEIWKVFCKNAQVDATNAILEKSGSTVRVPRHQVPSMQSSPPPYSPHPYHAPAPNYGYHPSAPPPGQHFRPTAAPLMHHMSSSNSGNTNGGSGGGFGGAYAGNDSSGGGGGGGGGVGSGADLINNLINASSNNTAPSGSSGGGDDGTAAFLNSLVNASNSGYGGASNGMGLGTNGLGGAGFDPSSVLNTGSGIDPSTFLSGGVGFDPTSLLLGGGLFS